MRLYPQPGIRKIFSLLFFLVVVSEILQKKQVQAQSTLFLPPLIPDFFASQTGEIRLNPLIHEQIHSQNIQIDGRLYAATPKSELMQAQKMCEQALSDLLTDVTWLPKGQLIADLKAQRLSIALIPWQAAHSMSSTGLYSVLKGELGVVYHPDASVAYYKSALQNELISHLVAASNKRCGISTQNNREMSFPFLKKDGKIDRELKKYTKDSIDEGLNRIKYIQQLWDKRKKIKLTPLEKSTLQKSLSAVKHYEPKLYYSNLSDIGGEQGLHRAVTQGILRKEGYHLEPGPNYPKNSVYFYGYIKGDLIIERSVRNYRSLTGKTNAFFRDFNRTLSFMKNPDGPYFSMDKNSQLTELGSFIAELPVKLLNILFTNFQNLQGSYLLRCSIFESPQPAIPAKGKISHIRMKY